MSNLPWSCGYSALRATDPSRLDVIRSADLMPLANDADGRPRSALDAAAAA